MVLLLFVVFVMNFLCLLLAFLLLLLLIFSVCRLSGAYCWVAGIVAAVVFDHATATGFRKNAFGTGRGDMGEGTEWRRARPAASK